MLGDYEMPIIRIPRVLQVTLRRPPDRHIHTRRCHGKWNVSSNLPMNISNGIVILSWAIITQCVDITARNSGIWVFVVPLGSMD